MRLEWKKCANAPVKMTSAQAVVVADKVYIGGGLTCGADNKILVYNWKRDTWSMIPECTVRFFALVSFMGQLIVAGGIEKSGSASTKMLTFRSKTSRWREFLPPMPTPRYHLTVVSTTSTIIAAGGVLATGEVTSKVEVFSNSAGQWHNSFPLPVPCCFMSSVIIGSTCYFLGGDGSDYRSSSNCFAASLPSLIESHCMGLRPNTVWECLPPTKLQLCAAASLDGSLVAIGGEDDNGAVASTVSMYNLRKNCWETHCVGQLPSPRSCCTLAQVSESRIVVIGGWNENGERFCMVDVGNV